MTSQVDEMFERRHRALRQPNRNSTTTRHSFHANSQQSDSLLRTSSSTYQSETNIGISVFAHNPTATDIESRPAAVARWSADDYMVEEVWPFGLTTSSVSSSTTTTTPSLNPNDISFAVVDVTGESVADKVILQKLHQRCQQKHLAGDGNAKGPQFLFPCDFFTSWRRRVRLPKRVLFESQAFAQPSILNLAKGNVYLSAAMPVTKSSLAAAQSIGLPLTPPNRRYTIVLRGIDGSIDSISKKWQSIGKCGVINYCPHVRHGVHASRAYEAGLSLMSRDFTSFLVQHLRSLTEGLPLLQEEVQQVEDLLRNPQEAKKAASWKQAVAGMSMALRRSEAVLDQSAFTGIYDAHPSMLLSTIERFASLCRPSQASGASSDILDSALLIRETISRRVLQDKLRTVADVHFNALVSLRLQWLGPKVRVGDLVCTDPQLNLDPFETKPDTLFDFGEEHSYVYWERRADVFADSLHQQGLIKRVETEAEADLYQLTDIVLPRLGRPTVNANQAEASRYSFLHPSHKVNQAVFEDLATRLGVAPLREMRLSPIGGYRRLIVKPLQQALFLGDASRNISWGSAELGRRSYVDAEGVTRINSPVGLLSDRKHLARFGIPRSRRESFAAIGQRPGFVCAMQMELPVGVSPHSVLREMFRVKTVDTGAIARMLLKK